MKAAQETGTSHPRETTALVGHADAERAMLDAYRSGRMPHAWLIGGPRGIGKATLAYRFARFVLAHPDPAVAAVREATSLAIAADHPVTRRIAAEGHSDLFVLERTVDDKGKLRTVTTVDQVRRAINFFGMTAGEGGWRVCVVDPVDELQHPNGSNALLKMLEEPPRRALFLLVSHAPGRLLPTIRSRCRRLAMRALATAEVKQAAAMALGIDEADAALSAAAEASEGSVARAIAWHDGPLLALRERVTELLDALPVADPQALHKLGEALERGDKRTVDVFVDAARDWLSGQLVTHAPAQARQPGNGARLARVSEVWDKLDRTARETDAYNLDRKPMVFSVFSMLAETTAR